MEQSPKLSYLGLVLGILLVGLLGSCSPKPLDLGGTVSVHGLSGNLNLPYLQGILPSAKLQVSQATLPWTNTIGLETTTDLYLVEFGREAMEAVRANKALELRSYLPRMTISGKPYEGVSKLLSKQGSFDTYFVPISLHLWGLWENTDLSKKLQLPVPSSLETLEKNFAQIKEAGYTPMALGSAFGWPALAWVSILDLALNGPIAHEKLFIGQRTFDDPSFTPVFETLIRWKNRGYFDTEAWQKNWPESLQDLKEDRAVYVLLSAQGLSRFPNISSITFTAIPGFDDHHALLCSLDGALINQKSPSPESALAVLAAILRDGVSARAPFKIPTHLGDSSEISEDQNTIQAQQTMWMNTSPTLFLPLDRVVSAQQAYNLNQTMIQFFTPGRNFTSSELGRALARGME